MKLLLIATILFTGNVYADVTCQSQEVTEDEAIEFLSDGGTKKRLTWRTVAKAKYRDCYVTGCGQWFSHNIDYIMGDSAARDGYFRPINAYIALNNNRPYLQMRWRQSFSSTQSLSESTSDSFLSCGLVRESTKNTCRLSNVAIQDYDQIRNSWRVVKKGITFTGDIHEDCFYLKGSFSKEYEDEEGNDYTREYHWEFADNNTYLP